MIFTNLAANIVGVLLTSAAIVGGMETTVASIKLPNVIEGNSVYGEKPSRLKLYAIHAPLLGAVAAMTFLLHTWLVNVPVFAFGLYETIHNYRNMKKAEKALATGK